MTVYVDNYRCPTTIGRLNGRWSHLTADTPTELQDFATRLGLRRAWFQARCRYATCPAPDGVCVHYHYDVVDTMRARAIQAGAIPIDIRDFGALISARRRNQPAGTVDHGPDVFAPVATEHDPVLRHSAPGLGITPDVDDGTGRLRYSIVHLGSRLAVFGCVTARCSTHLHQAVAAMAASGIDWTRPAAVLKTDERLRPLRQNLIRELGLCFDPETGRAIRCVDELAVTR